MIYVSGGIKGGSGKTTVATNLAIGLTISGKEMLLVDADDQESATDFTSWRNQTLEGNSGYTAVQLNGMNVRQQVMALSQKYEDIVIDTGGRDTESQRAALTVADVALFPFEPRSLNIWTIEKLSKLLTEIYTINQNLKAYAFINKADHYGKDNDSTSGILQENKTFHFLKTSLGNRKSFANAATLGLGVIELVPKDQKAIDEFSELFFEITQTKLCRSKKEVA